MKLRKIFSILTLFLLTFLLTGCSLPFIGSKKKAALQVMSEPKATVFLNGNHVGQTSYFDEELKPGEYTLKLIPEGQENKQWQKDVQLTPGVLTVANYNFKETEEQSNGYLLSLEPISQKDKAQLSIISMPDGAVVSVDGEPKGFTPLSLDEVNEGEHVINISTPGYQETEIQAKTIAGYKLIANVQLGRSLEEEATDSAETDEEATASAEKEDAENATEDAEDETIEESDTEEETTTDTEETETETETDTDTDTDTEEDAQVSDEDMERPYVEIKETSTGWLNLRSEPSTAEGDETVIKKIDPGDKYPFIEVNDTGWYKIEYEEGKEGWISGKYAELYR